MVTTENHLAVARHETFALRDGWLLKGLEVIRHNPVGLSEPGCHHSMGVGKNMASAIRYWVQATGLATGAGKRQAGRMPLRWTKLAEFIIDRDPFLEDIATLWLLHFELASRKELATFWYWAFNEYDDIYFTEDDIIRGFIRYASTIGTELVSEGSVRKDARVFLHTYKEEPSSQNRLVQDSLDCPLAALGLVTTLGAPKPYGFAVGSKPNLPLEIVAYAMFHYRDRAKPDAEVISLDELRWAPYSPGRLFLLDARTLVELSERIEQKTQGVWVRLSQTAGLRNVHLGSADPFEALVEYYERGRNAIT